jgi:hypothetical protein
MKIIRTMTCTTGRHIKLTVPVVSEIPEVDARSIDEFEEIAARLSPQERDQRTLYMDVVDERGDVIKDAKLTEAEEREAIAELERLKLIPREAGDAMRAAQLRRN